MNTNFAKRILSAYEREIAAKDAEIARLKSALKPVMSCESVMASDGSISTKSACLCYSAIREAQRIMKEGESK